MRQFEWDATKAAANCLKHRISFADAVAVFGDEQALSMVDEHTFEERYVAIGVDAFGRVLVVAYCWRGERIRLISARKATRRERRHYRGQQ
jgi:uncharacterized protein